MAGVDGISDRRATRSHPRPRAIQARGLITKRERVRNRLKLIPALALAAVALALAAGCGGSDGGDDTPAPASAAAGSFPVTLKDKFGTTVVPAQPKRVIALSYEEDTLATLGITPIAYAKNEYKTDGLFPCLAGK